MRVYLTCLCRLFLLALFACWLCCWFSCPPWRCRIACEAPNVRHVAFLILNEILERNFIIRDMLKGVCVCVV